MGRRETSTADRHEDQHMVRAVPGPGQEGRRPRAQQNRGPIHSVVHVVHVLYIPPVFFTKGPIVDRARKIRKAQYTPPRLPGFQRLPSIDQPNNSTGGRDSFPLPYRSSISKAHTIHSHANQWILPLERRFLRFNLNSSSTSLWISL